MKKVQQLSLLLLVLIVGCKPDIDNLPINEVQVIGSHNSYHKGIDPLLFKYIQKISPEEAQKLAYKHIKIRNQLSMGLRSLEIDVFSDPKGGRYAHPKGLTLVKGQAVYDPDSLMYLPGFKVFHVPDVDFRSWFLTFRNCLLALKNWSDTHADHYPIFITMNTKNNFDSSTFTRLDSTIIHDLGRKNLILPDDIRGSYSTLEEAALHHNWPKVKEARGKFIFILDQHDQKRDTYMKGHPSLKGRVLFVDVKTGNPDAAIMIMNDPKKQQERIKSLVEKGFIVRTRADANTTEARNNDYSRFKAACASGAQIITTDYYKKSTYFESNYHISFEGNKYVRVNPIFRK